LCYRQPVDNTCAIYGYTASLIACFENIASV